LLKFFPSCSLCLRRKLLNLPLFFGFEYVFICL
jgi:hypothetical protein